MSLTGRPPLSTKDGQDFLAALDSVLLMLGRQQTPSHPTCPVDQCVLLNVLEPCPACAARNMTDACLGCGTAVSPWAPCPVCALIRASGRRPLIVRPLVPAGE